MRFVDSVFFRGLAGLIKYFSDKRFRLYSFKNVWTDVLLFRGKSIIRLIEIAADSDTSLESENCFSRFLSLELVYCFCGF